MLEFDGDVAVVDVDRLVHDATYVVEIDVVADGHITHSFPPAEVYIS